MLDWEMATIGDPLMDLGGASPTGSRRTTTASTSTSAASPPTCPGMLTRREVVRLLLRCDAACPAENWTFYEVFGLFRLAAIIQQIYYRYHHKQTHNPAFKRFWLMVNYLHWRCRRVIAAGGT